MPLKEFYGNVAYAAKNGLEIWKHMQVMNDGDGVIHSFTAWNISSAGIDVHYSGRLKIRNARLLSTAENYAFGVGISTNFLTQGITIEDSVILGFQVGIKAPVRQTTNIIRGYIAAAIGIDVEKGEATDRVVNVKGTMFRDLPAAALLGRTQKKIYLHAPYDFAYPGAPGGVALRRGLRLLLARFRRTLSPLFQRAGPSVHPVHDVERRGVCADAVPWTDESTTSNPIRPTASRWNDASQRNCIGRRSRRGWRGLLKMSRDDVEECHPERSRHEPCFQHDRPATRPRKKRSRIHRGFFMYLQTR